MTCLRPKMNDKWLELNKSLHLHVQLTLEQRKVGVLHTLPQPAATENPHITSQLTLLSMVSHPWIEPTADHIEL